MKEVIDSLGEVPIIAGLLLVVAIVWWRLPKLDLGHSPAYRRRRVLNWLPLGATYAMLYFGRYNIKVSQHTFGDILFQGRPLMTNQDFAIIFGVGTLTYGSSFVFNGPLTDKMGGKKAILIAAAGAAAANFAIGILTHLVAHNPESHPSLAANLTYYLAAIYAINMYFQSFGAVAIVKTNAPWFYLRERGNFGAIFGILISLGIYFAFDISARVIENINLEAAFLIPAALLVVFFVLDTFMVKNTPGEAGFKDFNPGDATEDGPRLGVVAVFKKMMTNPIIITIALIEFCSGFMRNAVMQWFRSYAKQTDDLLQLKGSVIYEHWGFWLCAAGILGGVFAGFVSDTVFKSRRGPVAFVLYAGLFVGSVALVFLYTSPLVGWIAIIMNLCVVGVHGMLSGTASVDFGGKHNAGIAVGIIDGFVYAGTAFMAMVYGFILPDDTDKVAAANPENWIGWPVAMVPMSLIGALLALKVWNARPKNSQSGAAESEA